MTTNLSFQKIATVPASGLVVGRIYFETSTGMIKVARSATAVDKFGNGVKSASWDESAKILKIINESREEISLNLSDVASDSVVTTELAKKLNIGVSSDAAGTQSYYGLKKDITAAQTAATNAAKSYTDTEIGKIPAAIVYKGDGTTVTQSETSTAVTFAVGEIPQSKVTNLITDLADKATTTALNAVKTTADAAAPQATTYTKIEVDNAINAKVASTFRYMGSCTYAELPENAVKGDVWNVTDAYGNVPAGTNYAYDGEAWDALAGVVDLSPYATKATVTSEIKTKIGTLDKADTEVDGQVVSAVSETDGIITVSRRALVETDIPTLAISKVTGLQGALNAKVPTSRTVNTKPLTANVVLTGGDILVGGEGTYKDGSIQDAIDALDEKVTTAVASGVQSFGGKTGAITLKATASTNGAVNLTMNNNELQGAVVGLKSAAFVESNTFATATQGAKADSAVQNIATGSANGTIAVDGTDVAVKGLSSAAYVATTAFDAAGSANKALTDAKAYADSLMEWADFA
jgi:hypothetical protein